MAEAPPLNRIYVFGYSANDRDYPIVSLTADPRVAGYQVPKDLSACPDKRYPNHVFTGAQPISGDQRVRHVWEILPSPWVPFTRYDDDLGPVQGRRRSVKNEGQVASLTADKRTTYEAREGSAIVYTELEETWSIKVDEDGNSLFPIRDRDFYDPSRGPIQERRQLFVPTGEEVGSLENVNGVITQTSYEPYNEFLSVKIVQTYKVNGPQLIGRATDNEGQLVTITTQRKAADGYVPPSPTATRTVEANREDAESLIERIVDIPEVFSAKTFAKEATDPAPAKFRIAAPATTTEENVAGTAQEPSLASGDISKSEQQVTKFVKRLRSTFRNLLNLPKTLTQKSTNNEGQVVTVKETLQSGDTIETPTARKTVESEALGDGTYLVRTTEVPEIFEAKVFRKTREDLTPQKFKAAQEDTTTEATEEGIATTPVLEAGEFSKSEQQINKFLKRISTTSRDTTEAVTLEESLITQQGQVAKRTLNLVNVDPENPPVLSPDEKTIDGSIEALGDGRVVISETKVENVFPNKTIRKTKEDLTPQKFKAAQEDVITEENVAGAISDPNSIVLNVGEFAKSEEQITEFVKRISSNTRDVSSVVLLEESVLTPQGQVATRTLTMVAEDPNNPSSKQTIQPSAKLIDGSIEALGDGRTVKTETRIPIVFDSKTVGRQQTVQLPAKFITDEQEEESIVAESTEATPEQLGENGIGVVESTAQRITDFTVRKTKTTRSGTTSLEEKQLNNEGQEITISSSIVDSPEIESGATVEIARSQSIGGGKYLKEIGTVESIFDSKQETLSQSVQIPAKFFSGEITETSIIEEGEEAVPDPVGNDGFGIIQSTAQRISQFKVRKTQRTQNGDASLSERQSNSFKQKITVTSSIDDDPEISLNATTEFARSEAIGGGKYLKEVGVVSGVFDNRSLSASRPDVLPERFRAAIPTATTQETVAQQSVSQPSLGTNDIEKTETRITDFTVRKSTVSRNISGTPTLSGMDYEESFDVQIPYKEKIQNSIPAGSAEAIPLDNQRFLVREYDPDSIETYLSSFLQTYPTTINMNLPRILEQVSVTWDEKKQEGRFINSPIVAGTLYSGSSSTRGEASGFHSATPLVSLRFRDVWSQNIPATIHVFFLKNPVTESEILSKTGSLKWPTFKPKSHIITGKGVEVRSTVGVGSSLSIQQPKPGEFGWIGDTSSQRDFSRSMTPISINIPPCLHGNITINETRNVSVAVVAASTTAALGGANASVADGAASSDTASISAQLGSTNPSSIPISGIYLVDSSVDFFKYGFSIIRATTIDASIFAP